MDMIQKAINIAIDAHDGQKDRGGIAYINHPIYLSLMMETTTEIIVALLHDVIEDSDKYTLSDIVDIFGTIIANAVDCITKRKGEKYEDYLVRVKSNEISKKVKFADIRHNLHKERITEVDEKYERMAEKYDKALDFLLSD